MADGLDYRIDTSGLEHLIAVTPTRLDNWLYDTSHQMRDEMAQSILDIRSQGRTYGDHVASLPGFPPNTDTGTLADSLEAFREGFLAYRFQAGADYWMYLEFGTEKMEARPFIAPVFDDWSSGRLEESAQKAGLFD